MESPGAVTSSTALEASSSLMAPARACNLRGLVLGPPHGRAHVGHLEHFRDGLAHLIGCAEHSHA